MTLLSSALSSPVASLWPSDNDEEERAIRCGVEDTGAGDNWGNLEGAMEEETDALQEVEMEEDGKVDERTLEADKFDEDVKLD